MTAKHVERLYRSRRNVGTQVFLRDTHVTAEAHELDPTLGDEASRKARRGAKHLRCLLNGQQSFHGPSQFQEQRFGRDTIGKRPTL